jgi:hypothetical protein
MSQTLELTPVELRRAGWKVLKKHMGTAAALKFLLQYEKGEGDYTEIRRELFKDRTVESLIKRIKKEKKLGKRR